MHAHALAAAIDSETTGGHAVANITSVKAMTDTNRRTYGVIIAVVGLLLALTGTTAAIVLGAAAPLVGVLLALFGKYTEVVITTGAAEQQAFRSREENIALAVASAINLAVMKRSAALGRRRARAGRIPSRSVGSTEDSCAARKDIGSRSAPNMPSPRSSRYGPMSDASP